MVLSKRVSALAASPASSSLLPSSVSRNDAARCGEMPGVILASNELSSGNGAGVDSGEAELSAGLEGREESLPSRPGIFGAGDLDFKSCSRILPSWGSGLRANSGGGTGAGGGAGGNRGAEMLPSFGGKGLR